MMATIATVICAAGICWLFYLDADPKQRTSAALWIPAVWLALQASRMVTDWVAPTGSPMSAADAYQEGSPLDRAILAGLLLLGLVVLYHRQRRVFEILRANLAISVFYFYCLASVLWSDFPDVAFKRWIKFLSDLVMVLVVLTEINRIAALKRLLARLAFVLVPLSVLLIVYYPNLGRMYNLMEGHEAYTGVATDKNMLGKLCLLVGLATIWRLRQIIGGVEGKRQRKPMIAHLVVLAMILWLLWNARSATSMAAFAVGAALILITATPVMSRRPWVIHTLVWGAALISFSALFIGPEVLRLLGRDPTLTGRTEIWANVLRIDNNPFVGAGFESFWLGPRLAEMWRIYWWHPNQAHNGYIEIFLNLGGLGVALLLVVIASGYRNIVRGIQWDIETSRLKLAYFICAIVTNFTESNFKMLSLLWMTFLLAIISVPRPKSERRKTVPGQPSGETRRAFQEVV